MKQTPVEYVSCPESVLILTEKVESVRKEGAGIEVGLSGRLCSVRNAAIFNDIVGSGAKFWLGTYGDQDKQSLRLEFLSATSFRLRMARKPIVGDRQTPMVVGDIREDVQLSVDDQPERCTVTTPDIQVRIDKDPFRITVVDNTGKQVMEFGGPQQSAFAQFDALGSGFIVDSSGVKTVAGFTLAHDEKIMGMGERFSGINRRGETVTNLTCDGIGNATTRCYKPIPFYLSSRGYGVFFNTPRPFRAWIGSQSHAESSFVIEEDELDFYFFFGPALTDVLKQYTALTGRAPMLPEWSFKYWASRNSYETAEEGLKVARRFREEKLDASVIHFDPPWMGIRWGVGDEGRPLCTFEWDDESFGSKEETVRQLREMGYKISLWQLPYIDQRYADYDKDVESGALVEGFIPGDKPHKVGVIDFSSANGVEWYKGKLRPLLEACADVIKVDFGETSPMQAEYEGYPGIEMHNLYPLLYNKAAFEVTEEVKGENEAIIWARPAYAGSQRYPVHWSGDPDCTWESLAHVIKGGLSFMLSGFTFWTSDIGGYLGTPSPELFIRWTQFGMFCSHARAHGNTPREPWQFGDEALANFRKYLDLRLSLMPYILREAEFAATEGQPFMRPLVLDYQDDPTFYHIEDQFLFGRDILVAPVIEQGAKSRRVYIPAGEWVDWWTKEPITGPKWITRDCPLDVMPLYAKAEP